MISRLASVAAALLLCSLAGTGYAEDRLKPYTGETPPLILKTLDGESVALEDFAGKVRLVHFWATYCPPCRAEMPSMNRLQSQLGDDFVILGVNMGEPEEEVRSFVEEVGPEFRILLDHGGGALREWKVFAAPVTFVVDPEGVIRYTMFGATEWDSDDTVATLATLM